MNINEQSSAGLDFLSLGEVMLRLDPGQERVAAARSFTPHEGGGEYNVARGLARVFGRRAAHATALAENPVGRLIEGLMLAGGVDLSFVRWVPYDGIGRSVRNGLNFTERGFGIRPPLGCSDRGNTAASMLRPGDFDFDGLFASGAVRWFHTGGIFAALSDTTAALAIEALLAARRHGVTTSYDVNYRPSLWQDRGGESAARVLDARLIDHVDVLFGYPVPAIVSDPRDVRPLELAAALEAVRARHPDVAVIASPMRRVVSASHHVLGGFVASRTGVALAEPLEVAVLDRIGSGDAFASGVIHVLLESGSHDEAVSLGVAHGALVMTTPGDNSQATSNEVLALARSPRPDTER